MRFISQNGVWNVYFTKTVRKVLGHVQNSLLVLIPKFILEALFNKQFFIPKI